MKLYPYIGPPRIAEWAAAQPPGRAVQTAADVTGWLRDTGQTPDAAAGVIATFVVDEAGVLRVADRRSEHVACSGGGPVQAAGEITFAIDGGQVRVPDVSNQSTGYGPDPSCWPAVAAALARAGIAAPPGFTRAYLFRRCPGCASVNLIKDAVFECLVCGATLPGP